MRGSYQGDALRQSVRQRFANEQIPKFTKKEVVPLVPLLPQNGPIRAFDVGANKGIWAKSMINVFGDRLERIDMFDPSPENCRELRNREDNLVFADEDFSKLHVHQYAVGSERGEVTLYTNDDGSPLASLYPHTEWGFGGALADVRLNKEIKVQMAPLDEILDEQGLQGADVMKIDTEGYEMAVLQGISRRLATKSIGLIVFEFGIHQIESRHFFMDFYRFFADVGYTMYEHVGGQYKAIPEYRYRFEDFRANSMFVAKA